MESDALDETDRDSDGTSEKRNAMEEFEKELTVLINRHNIERKTDMPDFMMAEMICRIIESIGQSVKKTLDWHGCDSICHRSPHDQEMDTKRSFTLEE